MNPHEQSEKEFDEKFTKPIVPGMRILKDEFPQTIKDFIRENYLPKAHIKEQVYRLRDECKDHCGDGLAYCELSLENIVLDSLEKALGL